MKVDYIEHSGTDLSVANIARVSFDKESGTMDGEFITDPLLLELLSDATVAAERRSDPVLLRMVQNAKRMVGMYLGAEMLKQNDVKLIGFLARNAHWTPFAHPVVTLRLRAPFPIIAQAFKHKVGFVENSVSRRYVTELPRLFTPAQWREQSADKKQGSAGPLSMGAQHTADLLYSELAKQSEWTYRKMLELGVAAEQARFALLLGHQSEWIWTGSIAAYARFYALRDAGDAQGEIQTLARLTGPIIESLFPVSWRALTRRG